MSDKQTIDYDALAKQHGATNVDYDALAQQHGGRTESTTAKSNTVTGRKITAEPSLLSIRGLKSAAYNVADKITNLLPAAGGIAGGIIGASSGVATGGTTSVPGAIGGAALGGAAGESARQLSRRAIFPAGADESLPKTSLDAAKDIGIEGVKQGLYEAGGQGLRVLGKAMAPRVAEAAVAPGKRLLKSIPEDVNIGKTILNESKTVRPKSIVKELEQKIADHSAAVDTELSNAALSGKQVPLTPARQIVADESATAVSKNSPSYIRDVNKVADQLSNQYGPTGEVVGQLPTTVDPARARSLRQGIDLSIGNWNPESQAAIEPLRKRVYGAITGKIHDVVPETVPHDEAMTALIPSKDAVWNTSFNPGITRNVFERIARPTGALVGSAVGAEEGYKYGGVGGAVAGGLTGLVVPHVITSPTGMMIAARALDSPITPRAIRIAAPIGEGLMTHPPVKLKDDGPDESEQ